MKKSKLMTKDERAFQVAAVIVLGVLSLCAILPFVLIFIASFTEEKTLTQYGYTFFPRKLSLDAYKYLANNFATIGRAYLTSICLTAVGTALSMLLTTMFAYPLSRSDFKYRYPFAFFLFFTMLFHGGIVPSYMVWTRIFHVVDSYLALLLPNLLMGAFNVQMCIRDSHQWDPPVFRYALGNIAGEILLGGFGSSRVFDYSQGGRIYVAVVADSCSCLLYTSRCV